MRGIGKVLYAYLQDVQSLLAPGIAAAFLLGVVSKKTTPAAGLTGLLTGFTIGMLRLGFTIFKGHVSPDGMLYSVFIEPNWLHYEIINFAIVILDDDHCKLPSRREWMKPRLSDFTWDRQQLNRKPSPVQAGTSGMLFSQLLL